MLVIHNPLSNLVSFLASSYCLHLELKPFTAKILLYLFCTPTPKALALGQHQQYTQKRKKKIKKKVLIIGIFIRPLSPTSINHSLLWHCQYFPVGSQNYITEMRQRPHHESLRSFTQLMCSRTQKSTENSNPEPADTPLIKLVCVRKASSLAPSS